MYPKPCGDDSELLKVLRRLRKDVPGSTPENVRFRRRDDIP